MFLEKEQEDMLRLTKIGIKITGREYYGLPNPSLKFQGPIATINEKKSWTEMEE